MNKFENRKAIGKQIIDGNSVDEQVHKTIDYLKQNNLKALYLSHCTSFVVRAEINKVLPVKEVGVGLEINW